MPYKTGILIFNRNDEERRGLAILMKTEDAVVFNTSDALEALHYLQTENIKVVLVGSELAGIQKSEFKNLVEKIRPGVSIIFTSPLSAKNKDFSIDRTEFVKLVRDYLRNESVLGRDLMDMKEFAYSVTDRLLQIFAVNDRYFFNNDHLVAELSGKIAAKLDLDKTIVEAIRMAALLRDLGRVVIHQQILEESKRLNQTELMPIKAHPLHTMQILKNVRFPWNLDSIISQHHEHYDGSGYPMGLKGREISVGARIINVVDAYYALTTDRPYRKALNKEAALLEIKKNAGAQFDPEVVEVFLSIIGEEASLAPSRKTILVFERRSDIAAMIKLGTTNEDISVIHATSSIEAISRIRQKNPQLIIADLEALDFETFMRFYNTARQVAAEHSDFLLITSHKDLLSRFEAGVEYIMKPLNIDQITSKIRGLLFRHALPITQEEVRGLTGTLDDFNLMDILQILCLGLKTARVEIAGEHEKGMIYLVRGKIVHASIDNVRGQSAFFELIQWMKGDFSILHGLTPTETNITADTMHLLMDAAQLLDEKKEPGSSGGKQLSRHTG